MINSPNTAATSTDWRGFMGRHRGVIVIFALTAVLALLEAIYVFQWFASTAQSSGLVPSILGLWTMGNLVSFAVYLILWELLLVGVPVGIAALILWRWWKRLPEEESMRFRFHGRSGTTGGGLSFLVFVFFCIKVFIDGKWNLPIASFTLDYVVGSVVTILLWGLVIFGIPAAIALTWWLSREMKRV